MIKALIAGGIVVYYMRKLQKEKEAAALAASNQLYPPHDASHGYNQQHHASGGFAFNHQQTHQLYPPPHYEQAICVGTPQWALTNPAVIFHYIRLSILENGWNELKNHGLQVKLAYLAGQLAKKGGLMNIHGHLKQEYQVDCPDLTLLLLALLPAPPVFDVDDSGSMTFNNHRYAKEAVAALKARFFIVENLDLPFYIHFFSGMQALRDLGSPMDAMQKLIHVTHAAKFDTLTSTAAIKEMQRHSTPMDRSLVEVMTLIAEHQKQLWPENTYLPAHFVTHATIVACTDGDTTDDADLKKTSNEMNKCDPGETTPCFRLNLAQVGVEQAAVNQLSEIDKMQNNLGRFSDTTSYLQHEARETIESLDSRLQHKSMNADERASIMDMRQSLTELSSDSRAGRSVLGNLFTCLVKEIKPLVGANWPELDSSDEHHKPKVSGRISFTNSFERALAIPAHEEYKHLWRWAKEEQTMCAHGFPPITSYSHWVGFLPAAQQQQFNPLPNQNYLQLNTQYGNYSHKTNQDWQQRPNPGQGGFEYGTNQAPVSGQRENFGLFPMPSAPNTAGYHEYPHGHDQPPAFPALYAQNNAPQPHALTSNHHPYHADHRPFAPFSPSHTPYQGGPGYEGPQNYGNQSGYNYNQPPPQY